MLEGFKIIGKIEQIEIIAVENQSESFRIWINNLVMEDGENWKVEQRSKEFQMDASGLQKFIGTKRMELGNAMVKGVPRVGLIDYEHEICSLYR